MTMQEIQSTVNGIKCQTMRSGANGEYQVLFNRADASLEQIEGMDWAHPELGGKFNELPAGYGFEVKSIDYHSRDSTYHVKVKVLSQYLGDVTGYVKQVEELEAANKEQAAALQEATDLIQGMVDSEVENIIAGMGGDE